jgi:8-oxo-dGTP pyrophosphatase MutT (NUDIX family)
MPRPDPARLRRTGGAAVVFDDLGRILLHKRSDNGKWGLPGGSIEVGERADESIVREVKEETGYEVKVVRLIGIYSDPAHTTMTYSNGDVVSYVSLLFECAVVGGAPVLSDESTAVDWFAPDALPQPFTSNHIPRVQDAVARRVAAFYR